MIINFKNNILETKDNSNINLNTNLNQLINSFVDKINNFWTEEIWNINKPTYIKSSSLSDVFLKFKNIEKEYNETKVKFSINQNYDIMIDDNKKKIKKKIANFKKDNLLTLKIHSDCFVEYHNIIFDYLNKKNNLGYYNLELDLKSNIKQEYIKQEYILDDIIIKEQINILKNNLISCKNYSNTNFLIETLEKNIFKIKDILVNFVNQLNVSNPILLIDVENILKSFGIQNFLKSYITEEKFNKYFNTWNNGYFGDFNDINSLDNNSITLSEYSSKTKYIEPFTSLNLSLEKKLKLIKILIDKSIKNTNTINILTSNFESKKQIDLNNLNDLNDPNNSTKSIESIELFELINQYNLYIPLQYNNKFDIREQDDHLIVLLYMLLKKINLNPIIISNDKFKWFEYYESLEIKNFKLLYDFDSHEKKIIIDIPYTPSIYKINSCYYMIPFINYPILQDDLNYNILSLNKLELIIKTKFKKITSNDINKIFVYLFHLSIIGTNNISKLIEIINFISNYLEYIELKFNKIIDFLSVNSKEKIFKISIETNLNLFSEYDINNYLMIMDNYLELIEIYIVIKFIVFKNYSNLNSMSELIYNLSKIFNYIMIIYDTIDIHIYKIRKLSGSKIELGKLFKKINTIYIYVRKQGYMKKNIF